MSEMHKELHVPVWTLGDRLEKALRDEKISNAEMAEYLGVSRNTVGNYIADRTPPTAGTLRLWALRCGVPLEWLRSGTTDGSTTTGTAMNGGYSGVTPSYLHSEVA